MDVIPSASPPPTWPETTICAFPPTKHTRHPSVRHAYLPCRGWERGHSFDFLVNSTLPPLCVCLWSLNGTLSLDDTAAPPGQVVAERTGSRISFHGLEKIEIFGPTTTVPVRAITSHEHDGDFTAPLFEQSRTTATMLSMNKNIHIFACSSPHHRSFGERRSWSHLVAIPVPKSVDEYCGLTPPNGSLNLMAWWHLNVIAYHPLSLTRDGHCIDVNFPDVLCTISLPPPSYPHSIPTYFE